MNTEVKELKDKCFNCNNRTTFRYLDISECFNMRDVMATKGNTHKLCIRCNCLIPIYLIKESKGHE